MIFVRVILTISTILLSVIESAGQMDIRIRLGSEPTNIMVSIKEGHYTILAAEHNGYAIDTVWDIKDDDPVKLIHIKQQQQHLVLSSKNLGTVVLSELWLVPNKSDIDPSFIISGVGKNERWYQDVLHVYISQTDNKLTAVNQVGFEKYVAGVVESEGGAFPEPEFFKAQAVIARTFAMKNLKKHINEGYNLRDDVSSQVYHSRAYLKNAEMIIEATKATADSILV
ncbi:MAG: SpoIID/LytB domain-containing protein, partial [Cryomorphaceae bacterium]|nr:SpoIID/LytB domain-containing protein [Cryomorphaceae bacterium]